MLSTPAFNALLKILEEPPEHLMFILATTELHKVPATIKSRCQQFAFKRISPLDIAQRLKYVAGEEKIPLTADGAALLARLADGGMRDALSLLDQCATGSEGDQLGEQEILASLGLAGNLETAALMGEIASHDAGAALERLDRLYAAGKDVGSLLNELSSLARDLLIRKTAPRGGSGLLTGGYDEATLRGLSEALTAPRLTQMLGGLQATGADLGRSANRRVDAELCIIRLCDETLDDSAAGLNARVARLEELMAGGGVQTPVAATAQAPKQAPSRPTPPAHKDTPPWEAPQTAPKQAAEPPKEETEPRPAAQLAGQSAGAAPAGDFWPGLVAGLKGRVPMGEYSFLSNPAMVKGTIDGPLLTLWAQNDFVRNMVNKPGIVATVEKAAKLLPGGPYRVVVTVGEAPKAAPSAPAAPVQTENHDKLDDLLALGQQFGGIITEE
jgi:DNA polymerase-3 subunit gamma/tau